MALIATPALAYQIPDLHPPKFSDIEKVLNNDIPAALGEAMCGGWEHGTSVGEDLGEPGYISKVEGVPGREGRPLENFQSGMAKRIEKGGVLDDGFLFPDSTNGLATVCPPGVHELTRIVWDDGAQAYVTRIFEAPYFEDPPCPWRADGKLPDPMTPPQCQEFCGWLNGYTYADCKVIVPILDDEGNEIGKKCDLWGTKYLCAQTWVEQNEPNCKACAGAECRCEGVGCTEAHPPPPAVPQDNRYKSFFRQYLAHTHRTAMVMTEGPEKLGETLSDVGCYGFYWEYDPKFVVSERRSYRCVIDFAHNETDYIKFDQLRIGQMGKKGVEPAVPPEDVPAVVRKPNFDPKKDLWYPNLGAGLSFLTDPVFDKIYGKSLPRAFLNLDVAKQKVPTQVNQDIIMSTGALQRAFDDTVSNERGQQRTMIQWWQALQHRALRLSSPPAVRLRLPAEWVLKAPDSLASLDPTQAPETLEIQLQAGEELLGEIGRVLEKEFVLKTVDVPVVVPDGSPEEYMALAQRWHDYGVARKAADLTVPSEVQTIEDKLLEYAHQIEKYRLLRVQLPKYYNAILEKQEGSALEIIDWLKQNVEAYREWSEDRKVYLNLIEDIKTLQEAMQAFSTGPNMMWCRMDAFTTPIYSLLDPWLPARPGLNGGVPSCQPSPQGLPIICLAPGSFEMIIDLTYFRIQRNPITVPVPSVTRLHLQLPTPPGPLVDVNTADLKLPELPDVPEFSDAAIGQLPDIVTADPKPSVLKLYEPKFGISDAQQSLEQAKAIINQMTEVYGRFWRSLEKPDDAEPMECADWATDRCWYVEPELIQTFTRVTAQPAVFLKEHFYIAPTDDRPCDPAETACLPSFREERPPAKGWQMISQSASSGQMDPILQQLRTETREKIITPEGKLRDYSTNSTPIPFTNPATEIYPIFKYSPVLPLDSGTSSAP